MYEEWSKLYQKKLMSAAEAVKAVESGDEVVYPPFNLRVPQLDKALAARKDELRDIFIYFTTLTYLPEVVKADPVGQSFVLCDSSFSAATRQMQKNHVSMFARPGLYHEMGRFYGRGERNADVMFVAAAPMDENGYFSLSTASSINMEIVKAQGGPKKNLKLMVEINDQLPYVEGDNFLHISDVYAVVEGTSEPLMAVPSVPGTETDQKIAKLIMDQMEDGACIQLGIGGMPNLVGKMIAESDLKDLGCHTEMFVDAYLDMFKAGRLTNKRKVIYPHKSVFTFAMGSDELHRFVSRNPGVACLSASYTNDPFVIAQNPKVFSICSCIGVDLLGNVSSESVGYKQISATGGQLDYHFAAYRSEGGKGFVCLPSTSTDREGNVTSNIVIEFLPGTQISVPANMTNYVVTEYGVAFLKGKPMWDRIASLIEVAHPDFREGLIAKAEKEHLWRRSNKR